MHFELSIWLVLQDTNNNEEKKMELAYALMPKRSFSLQWK